jgi:hypothetical protein
MKHIGKYLLRTGIFFFAFYCCQQNICAQVKAVASANKNFFLQDDLVTLQFNVENADNVQQFIPPSFKGCKIIQGPLHVSGSSSVNGVESRYLSFVYILQPQAPGKYAFSGASAKVEGKRFAFNTLHVEVKKMQQGRSQYNFWGDDFTDAPSGELYSDYILRKGENLQDKIRKNLFIKVDIDKTSCYEGEPVVATYKLYTRLRSESKVSRRPSFNGFSVYDMVDPSSVPSTTEKLNGKDFNVYLIRKAQLYPLQSGALELDPAEVENSITFLKAEYAMKDKGKYLPELLRAFESDNAANEGVETQKVSIQSNPLTVNVKALPETDKPSSFDGAVGSFNIQVSIDKKEIPLKDAAVLKVIVKGQGNFGVLNTPVIHWPKDVEVFEPSVKEDFLKSVVPLSGYKTFEFTFMPKRKGKAVIPAIDFSYFDPQTNQYRTIATEPIQVNAIPALQHANADQSIYQANTLQEPGVNRTLILSIATALLLLFGFILYRYIQSSGNTTVITQATNTIQTAEENANPSQTDFVSGPLFKSRLLLVQQDNKAFYSELGKALRSYVVEKLQPSSTYLDVKKIEGIMRANRIDELVITQFNLVIQQCEIALYTPSLSDSDMQSAYDLAEDIIAVINKK